MDMQEVSMARAYSKAVGGLISWTMLEAAWGQILRVTSDYQSLQATQLHRGCISAYVHWVKDAERDMHKWIERVVMRNQPALL
jgi:uncharacterized protein YqgV (UPF0045/DUF77 family)